LAASGLAQPAVGRSRTAADSGHPRACQRGLDFLLCRRRAMRGLPRPHAGDRL